jgi:SpoVK/Ycf46/Vps4 family AAA+-type ATPase
MYPRERYISNKKARDPFQGLFYEADALRLVEDLKQWFTRESWYKDHGIPWRTGVLLHGPGGTGKSSMARAIAETLGVPLYQYYLSTFTDREFVNEWDNMAAPCVVALEDLDNVFHGCEPATEHKSLSFDCVLNQISGIGSLNGVLLIVTTNRLELIDPAMGRLDEHGRPTRPGRIDHVLHLGHCSEGVRRQIADYTLDGWADDLKGELVAEGANTTPAQFQRLCIDAALRRIASERDRSRNVIELSRKQA